MTIRLKYGKTNTYFVRGTGGGLLIDTDYAGTLSAFYKELKKNKISPADITYILATHFHPDHIGLVSKLQKLGIKLLLIDTQKDYVHFADDIFKRERHLVYEPIDKENAVIITCRESRDFLAGLGIAGEIIRTASHSQDSISVILYNGECMVGDLEPMEYIDAYEENVALQSDWEMIMNYKPEVIYYAHANEKRFVCKGGEVQDDRCKVCGLWKSKKVDMCPACGGKMDFLINGLSLLCTFVLDYVILLCSN